MFLQSVEKQAYVIALASCREPQTALDIVQDAMLSMVKSYSEKPAIEWKPLFFRVLNNRITDSHRKRGFGKLSRWFGDRREDDSVAVEALDQLASDSPDPVALADGIELNEEISVALGKLSDKQQQVLMHRLWLGLSVKETAAALNISEGTVKTHLSRGVTEMQAHLQEFYSP